MSTTYSIVARFKKRKQLLLLFNFVLKKVTLLYHHLTAKQMPYLKSSRETFPSSKDDCPWRQQGVPDGRCSDWFYKDCTVAITFPRRVHARNGRLIFRRFYETLGMSAFIKKRNGFPRAAFCAVAACKKKKNENRWENWRRLFTCAGHCRIWFSQSDGLPSFLQLPFRDIDSLRSIVTLCWCADPWSSKPVLLNGCWAFKLRVTEFQTSNFV